MEKKSIIGSISQISLIGIFAFFALACATTYNGTKTKTQLDPLMGKHVSIAIMQLGPQSYISDDGSGGNIYTWEYNEGVTTTSSTGYYRYNGQIVCASSGGETTENYCRKHVYVKSNGYIYYWRLQGNRCE
jgi:hypothetical protein